MLMVKSNVTLTTKNQRRSRKQKIVKLPKESNLLLPFVPNSNLNTNIPLNAWSVEDLIGVLKLCCADKKNNNKAVIRLILGELEIRYDQMLFYPEAQKAQDNLCSDITETLQKLPNYSGFWFEWYKRRREIVVNKSNNIGDIVDDEKINEQYYSDCALEIKENFLGDKGETKKHAELFPNISKPNNNNSKEVFNKPPFRVQLRNITNTPIPTRKITINQDSGRFQLLPIGCAGVIQNGVFKPSPKTTSVSFWRGSTNDTSNGQDDNNSMKQKYP